MPETTHETRLLYYGTLPFAHCSCGWEGPTRDRERDAANDGRAHERGDLLPGWSIDA